MTPQRIAGIVLLVVGIVLLIFGINASNSLTDQVSEGLTGRFTDRTMWYIIGGIALGVLGAVLMFVGPRRRLT
jgi:drug/metabolite transporter (DMT)-like permease